MTPRALPALALLLALACGEAEVGVGPASDAPLSLLWISLDTLRADHMGLYGYPRDTTPFLDGLAARAIVFDWAVAPQNSTLPSHMTMFSGLHPRVHGLMHVQKGEVPRLADHVPTLPEVLQRAGYETRAWTAGGMMAGIFGFGRGFEHYRSDRGPIGPKLGAVLKRIKERDAEQPFFYLVHTYDIHDPYQKSAPYDALFAPEDDAPASIDMAHYDGAIRFVDDHLRRFVTALSLRGVLAHTVLVITGDHGENFHEYGIPHTGHGSLSLHQSITRVPWIVVHPDPGLARRVPQTVGLIDFPNTMLALLGRDERLGSGGVDVLDPQQRRRPRAYASWTGQVGPDRRDAWSLYYDGHHLLESESHAGDERLNALYDVRADPGETRRLDDAERSRALRARLAELRAALGAEAARFGRSGDEAASMPEELERQLRALGYLE